MENHPLNKSSSKIFQYFGIFLLSLFISYLVFTYADRGRNIEQAKNIKEAENIEQAVEIEQAADINIVGVWQSEPILGQLGLIQSSYTFNSDGSYSNKLNMISFCEERHGQDCEYFWLLSDGGYSVKNGVITLSNIETKAVRLRKGQSKPEIKVQPDYPKSDEYMVKLEAGNLILTGIKDDESVIYKPFVATAKDEEAPSADAYEVEQSTDIVGVWQSEPVLGPVGLIQSSYTFNEDGSYSNKVDILRLCKDVPEQNCEYYWTVLDGKYAVKNGVITLYIKEVRTEILRKGKNKPDILIAPGRPHSGDEYIVKLDAGKLFMTGVKSNETVVFMPIDND